MPAVQQPYLLGIDTSGIACSVGLQRGSEPLVLYSYFEHQAHSRHLAGMVEMALQKANITSRQLDAIVVVAGPGSYTGLRIGFGLAKGIAHVAGIPIIPISTLDVLAFQSGRLRGEVVSLLNAHRGEIYWRKYHWADEQLKPLSPIKISAPSHMIHSLTGDLVTFVSPDLPSFEKEVRPACDNRRCQFITQNPSILAVLQLGLRKFHEKKWPSLAEIEPLYGRAFKGVL